MLAPNKQNLILLKNQKQLVQSGYKLLKEKRSGLIHSFLQLAGVGKQLEAQLEKEAKNILATYQKSLGFVSAADLILELTQTPSTKLNFKRKRVSGVYVNELKLQVKPAKRNQLKPGIQTALTLFAEIFPIILQLNQLKVNTTKIAKEIQKTSRQIVNLEQKIEGIKSEIKYISDLLSEKANFEKAVLIKIFK